MNILTYQNIVDEKKRALKDAIVLYFGNLIMTKVKDQGNYSFYYAKIGCLLCADNRYVVSIASRDNKPIGYDQTLSMIDWISFQTRTLTLNNVKLKEQNMEKKPSELLKSVIEKTSDDKNKTLYFSHDIPIRIELLKENESDKHMTRGILKNALDTFDCILVFTL